MPVAIASQPKVDPWEKRLDDYVYRNRAWIVPPLVLGALVAVAAVGHALDWSLWLAIAAGVILILGLDSVSDLPTRQDSRWWRRHEEHIFGGASWLLMCGWTAAVGYLGVTFPAVLVLGGCGFPLAILWWTHRRVRRSVAVDKKLRAWGDGAAVGLPGTRVRGKDAGEGWFSYVLRADEHGRYTLASYRQARDRIAAKHGVRAEAISFTEGDHEGQVIVTVREEERKTVEYEVSSEPLDIMKEHTIGRLDNGDPLKMALQIPGRGAQHGGAVGATGSGKSSLANRITEILVRSTFGLPWLCDFSPGAQELRAWAAAAHAFITTPDDAERMFDAAAAICKYRGQTSKDRLVVPCAQRRHIGIVMDEAATMFAPQLLPPDASGLDRVAAMRQSAARAQKHEQGVRLFRKYAVSEWLFTQYGAVEAFGGPVARDQLTAGYAAAFYAPKDLTGHLIIPAGHGLQVSQIPKSKPGTLGMLGPLTDGVVKGRVEYMTDSDIKAMAEEWADRQGDLTPGEIDAADRATDGWFSARPRTAPAADDDAFHAVDRRVTEQAVPVVVDGRKRMGSAEESRQLIWDVLASFKGGARREQVAERAGKSPDIVSTRLAELAKEGRVTRPARRGDVWKVVPVRPRGGPEAVQG